MSAEGHSPAAFYATSQGALTSRLLRARLLQLWPDLRRHSILGVGYTAPYLRAWRGQAERCVAAVPLQAALHAGSIRWPLVTANQACAVEDSALPFPDLSFDRILLVHGIEAAENARVMLREAWRVLRDDGRLMVVAPNRVGLWAHVESTPFGHGQPYSPGQIGRLLEAHLFRVERREFALYAPPTRLRLVLRTARFWEDAGRRYAPGLGGVTLTEAVKDAYATVPLARGRHRRRVLSQAG